MKKFIAAVSAAVSLLGAQALAAVTYDISDATPALPHHGLWLSNFIKNSSGNVVGAAKNWSLQDGSKIVFADDFSSATITASVINRVESTFGFDISVDLTLDATPPALPYCQSSDCKDILNLPATDARRIAFIDQMSYYEYGISTMTGTGDLAGITAVMTDHSSDKHPFQWGQGGDAFNIDMDDILNDAFLGGSGWFNIAFSGTAANDLGYTLMSGSTIHGDLNFSAEYVPVPGAVVLFGSVLAGWAARRKLAA
ncbi:MAG: PEP-CTERM sorting domain-containing protein [Pseudomonadota bacterium]